MTKIALIGLLLATGAPALAQTTQPAGPPETTAPTTPPASEQAPAPTTTPPADPATPTTTTTPTMPTTDQPATTTPATSGTEPAATGAQAATETSSDPVKATVDADWAKYDANSNDGLSRAEFDKWVTELQTAADKKAPTRGYLSAAFRKADADKNKSVSKDELATFLKG